MRPGPKGHGILHPAPGPPTPDQRKRTPGSRASNPRGEKEDLREQGLLHWTRERGSQGAGPPTPEERKRTPESRTSLTPEAARWEPACACQSSKASAVFHPRARPGSSVRSRGGDHRRWAQERSPPPTTVGPSSQVLAPEKEGEHGEKESRERARQSGRESFITGRKKEGDWLWRETNALYIANPSYSLSMGNCAWRPGPQFIFSPQLGSCGHSWKGSHGRVVRQSWETGTSREKQGITLRKRQDAHRAMWPLRRHPCWAGHHSGHILTIRCEPLVSPNSAYWQQPSEIIASLKWVPPWSEPKPGNCFTEGKAKCRAYTTETATATVGGPRARSWYLS